MLKYRKSAFVILLSFSSLFSHGQARQDFLDALTVKFRNYCISVPREEVYVNTDRQEYIAGEEMWFTVWLTDRQTLKPSGESRLAYIEILNPENRPVVQKRISLEEGFGTGQIALPDTLTSGTYTLIAYTNWMKNFLPENCFAMKFAVQNALNEKSFSSDGAFLSLPSKILSGNSILRQGRNQD